MAPIGIIFIVFLFFILSTSGLLTFLGIRGLKFKSGVKRVLGILSIILSSALFIFTVLITYQFVTVEDQQRKDFIGRYQLNNNSPSLEKVELIVDENKFYLTTSKYYDCLEGTWEPVLLDEGYIMECKCLKGSKSPQIHKSGNELIFNVAFDGEKLRFVKIED